MERDYDKLDDKELKEAQRFDRGVNEVYQSDSQLIIEPKHWEKFDTDKLIHGAYSYVVKSLGNLTGKNVLEVGCGTGIFSVILAKRGAQLVESFDVSKASIKLARRRAIINGVSDRVNFRAMSIYDMNYKEGFFDHIVGLNILHHIDIERMIDKIYVLLKHGGIAYFSEPFGNVQWLERLRLLIPVKVNEEDKSHWNEQLKYEDVEKFRTRFRDVECLEFHLFSRLDRLIKSKKILKIIAKTDERLMKKIPFLRKYARRIVIKAKREI